MTQKTVELSWNPDVVCLNPERTFYSQQNGRYMIGRESKTRIFDFQIIQERQKTELLLLGVPYIAESQTGLYLVTSKFNVIGVLNFQ